MQLAKQTPPKVGTTDYTTTIVQPTLQHLVQGAEVRNIADRARRDAPPPADVEKAITSLGRRSTTAASESKFQADVDRYGLTDADLHYEFQTSVLETKITDKLTNQVKVTDQDVQDYYDQNKAAYKTTSDSRVVDYALFPDKASAEAALKKLAGGRGLRGRVGGDDRHQREPRAVHCQKGQIDKAFEQSAFTLPTNQLSPLVKVDKAYATSNLGRQVPARLLLPDPADGRRGEGRHPAVVRLGQGPDPHAAPLDPEAVARDERPPEARGGPEEGDQVRHRLRAAADVDRALPPPRRVRRMATLVALGPGDPDLVPLAAWRALEAAGPVAVPDDEPLAALARRARHRDRPRRAGRGRLRRALPAPARRAGLGRGRARAATPCATCSWPTPWSGSSA